MITEPVMMGAFVMEVQNAKNWNPMKPTPCENMAAWVIGHYIDLREGAAWLLLAGYDGHLRFKRGKFDPEDSLIGITWESDVIRIGRPTR